MSTVRIGIIGGSGLYEADGLLDVRTEAVATPYGAPSDEVTIGRVDGHDAALVFLPRHGRGHRLMPSEVISTRPEGACQKKCRKYGISMTSSSLYGKGSMPLE